MRCTPLDAWIMAKLAMTESKLPIEALQQYQRTRLQAVIAKARTTSPFYRQRLHGLPDLHDISDLAAYPLLSAADVITQGLQMLCVSQSEISRVVTLATSGTEGAAKKLYFTAADQELTIDFFACGMSSLVQAGERVLIFLSGERPGSVGQLLTESLKRLQVHSVLYGLVDIVPKAVRYLCEIRPDCLVGIPVQLQAIANLCEKWKIQSWRPKAVLLSADRAPESVIRRLQQIWECEVFDHYGMTEMGLGGGIECSAHHGYHLRENDLFFEVIDTSTEEPLPEGQYGEVIFTTLTREGMPLIRYRTGDIARFIPGKCPCGSSLRRLEKIKARRSQIAVLGQNETLTLHDLDEVLFSFPDIINVDAELHVGEQNCLHIMITTWCESLDTKKILQVLRQITMIAQLEAEKHLRLHIDMLPWNENRPLLQGKRCFRITGYETLREGG